MQVGDLKSAEAPSFSVRVAGSTVGSVDSGDVMCLLLDIWCVGMRSRRWLDISQPLMSSVFLHCHLLGSSFLPHCFAHVSRGFVGGDDVSPLCSSTVALAIKRKGNLRNNNTIDHQDFYRITFLSLPFFLGNFPFTMIRILDMILNASTCKLKNLFVI